jgi:leader peptidase (prepilin peptidase) / N-methyltransferase
MVLIGLLALAGLVAGWGQHAIVARYAVPAGQPPRRNCPSCGHRLVSRRWPVPMGDLAGRCPACGERTGPPPLLAGIISAVLLGALAARVHPGLVLAAACWLALCCVPLGFIDAAVHRLPDLLTAPAYGGTVVLLLLAAVAGEDWHALIRALFGGAALAGLCLILTVLSPSGMGLGDVKLAAGLGTLLAWYGWRALLGGTLAGFALAACYGVVLLVTHRATRKQHIAFGPFLIVGAFAVLLAVP